MQVGQGLRTDPGRHEVHQQGHHQADQAVSEFVHYHQSQERPAPETIGEHVRYHKTTYIHTYIHTYILKYIYT